jgi:hypothetical protein
MRCCAVVDSVHCGTGGGGTRCEWLCEWDDCGCWGERGEGEKSGAYWGRDWDCTVGDCDGTFGGRRVDRTC